ncbi:MAG: hydroxyacid dehydrogenase [Clostridia bacterium]|nr:hydroxyacid dehydrogenase [Clostridia bacterium]
MKIVILDIATLGEDIVLDPIRQLGDTIEYGTTAPEEIAVRVRDAEVVIVNKLKLNESNLSEAKNLKLICVTATGYDNIDTDYCRKRGIALCNVPGYSTDSVAQLTLSVGLCLVNRLTSYREYVHSGAYSESGVANRLTPVYHELSSLTWGIVGGGAIGSRVAELASALGSRILVCRRQRESRYEQVDLEELCRRSDVISLHVPLSNTTRGMIGEKELSLMKPHTILINMARGAVTDEAAVARALEEGHLGGLGVDVYSKEPFDADHPFCRLFHRDNVCLTPHMAWGSSEARARCVKIIADNIAAFYEEKIFNRIV